MRRHVEIRAGGCEVRFYASGFSENSFGEWYEVVHHRNFG